MLAIARPQLGEEAEENLKECIASGWISSQGHFVERFEAEFAEYLGVAHAVATSSGTAALHLALEALGIGPGATVALPSFTFIATANVVHYVGAEPLFVDVEEHSWCLAPDSLIQRNRAAQAGLAECDDPLAAIIAVHLNGHPCDMEFLRAKFPGTPIIEDACQALGSVYHNRKLGAIGDVGCFSFFANKLLATGEGGMAVTDDKGLATTMRMLRDHGRTDSTYYRHDVVGFNYRMTNLQAAVGLPQIRKLDEVANDRRLRYVRMSGTLRNTQSFHAGQMPWLYYYRLPVKEAVDTALRELRAAGIESKPFYRACHLQRAHWDGSGLPISEALSEAGVMLPIHEDVTEGDIETMANTLAHVRRAV